MSITLLPDERWHLERFRLKRILTTDRQWHRCGWCDALPSVLFNYLPWRYDYEKPIEPGIIWFCNLRCYRHQPIR